MRTAVAIFFINERLQEAARKFLSRGLWHKLSFVSRFSIGDDPTTFSETWILRNYELY